MNQVANAPMDLRDRTLNFSVSTVQLLKTIRKDILNQPIINQLVRSVTSIGANFIEAKNASSARDFRNKVFIAKKEASETLYWLKICEEFIDNPELKELQDECQQIILILQRIVSPLKH